MGKSLENSFSLKAIWRKPKNEPSRPKRWSVNSKKPSMNLKTSSTKPSSEPNPSRTRWTSLSTKLPPGKQKNQHSICNLQSCKLKPATANSNLQIQTAAI